MSQTRLSNVSATQSEKLSRRLLKSPSTMTSKQPAVFLTRYVWSRNRPVCSLRESASSSSKLTGSEKIRSGNPFETKPAQKSSSMSMRPPGSPMWPPRSLRWPKHWEASLSPNTSLTATAKCQPTACSQMWLPVSVTTFSGPTTVQVPTLSQNRAVLSSTQVIGVSATEIAPKRSIETSMVSSTASHRLPFASDVSFDTCAKPSAFGNTSKNLVRNQRMRNSSTRAAKKSSVAPGQPQQLMRWPPRSVKWPNRWNKFSSIPRFSSESSARPPGSMSMPSETGSGVLSMTPKELVSSRTSRGPPKLQRNSTPPQWTERLAIRTISISKDMESSLESSVDSSPLSERSSRWTDSLETSGMSPVGSTESSSASQRSSVGPTRSLPVLTDQLTLEIMQSKESEKVEKKSSAQKSAVGSTTLSISSTWTPEKSCGALLKSTGQIAKFRKLQGQSPPRPTVPPSAKRLQRKPMEFPRPPAHDTSSSLESISRSLSPTSPVSSSKPELKLVRSATWPTEFPKSTSLLPECLITKESHSGSSSKNHRALSEPLQTSSSLSTVSLLKKSPSRCKRKSSSGVPLFSSVLGPCVSERQCIQSPSSSATLKNSPIFPKRFEVTDSQTIRSSKCLLALEEGRASMSSPALQKYSPKLTPSSIMSVSRNCTSPSADSSKSVRMTTASLPISQVSTKELQGSLESTAMLPVWPTDSSPSSRAPVVTVSSAALGDSWSIHKYSVTSERSQTWPQTQKTTGGSLPVSTETSDTWRRSQAAFSAGAATLDKVPAHSGIQSAASADFPQSSVESSKSFQSQGMPLNLLPRYSPGHLISSVTQLSLSPVVSQVSLETGNSAPRMLKKSSPAMPSLPLEKLPSSESSSERSLKRNARPLMAPTLSTKFQSRSALFESSSDTPTGCPSVSPSWSLVPPSRPELPSMASLGLPDRHRIETTSCLVEHNSCASHLAVCYAQTGSHAQSRNSVFAVSSPKMSQHIPAEPGEIVQKSLASCSRRSSLGLTPSSASFQPSSFQTSTTNIIVNTTASFPLVYSYSPSASHNVPQSQSSAGLIPGNFGTSAMPQASINPTSNSRHTQFVHTGNVTMQSVPSPSTKTDESETVPGVSFATAQPVTPSMWTTLLEMPSSSLHRKALPLHSETDVMSWTSNSCSKQSVTSVDTHSQVGSHVQISTSDSFKVSSLSSACSSSRLPAPLRSMASNVFPSITSAATESKLPMFNWISSSPLWTPGQLSSFLCTSTTTHLMTSAPAQTVTRSSQTWASSAAQLPAVAPSSKGPVVSAVVQTPISQPEPSVSWSRSRPAAWSSTSTPSATGVSGVQKGSSSGLVRLPIKYIKRQPLPRTGEIESTSSSNS